MAKVGDILKFPEPLMDLHKILLDKGGHYEVGVQQKYKPYQTADGVWHFKALDEYSKPKVILKAPNAYIDCGELSQYKDYEVVGRVEK